MKYAAKRLSFPSAILAGFAILATGFAAAQGSAAGSAEKQASRQPDCASAWNPTSPYDAGSIASRGGIHYRAAFWTQGNPPERGQAWQAGKRCRPAVQAKAADHDANFPPDTLKFLKANTGLDGEQWDNIMKLVNKPEQDSLEWTQFYGYCEDIKDKRGYTIGIFGATTGGSNDEGPDGPTLFKEFDASSGASNPSIAGGLARAGVHGSMQGKILKISDSAKAFCGKINALQNNAAWRDAMWNTFYKVYIQYSVQQARQRGFASALTIGSFVDTALNQGAAGDSGTLQGLLSRSGNSADEKTFMTNFYAQRSKIVDTHDYNQPPNGKNRVKQWSTLLNQGETDLKNADAAVRKVTDWEMK
ncbi:chitosanase [Chromobacterium phragmitis]|uniref:Chemotaxis protein n=1 Tax=Chromobacterium phragmitis TaxID=2202141 RepID=A0A344UH85_9NEIS|nr:chitosanase [Chromobacterium phragmitis]AXE34633.1 chemotaxis protein [Chromobacterium phragmitis]